MDNIGHLFVTFFAIPASGQAVAQQRLQPLLTGRQVQYMASASV
jgi:hypothetical protein